jgi:hypothetical protein
LPDVALQELRVVGEAIEDLGRGEREAFDLAQEAIVHDQTLPAFESFSVL